MKNQLEKTRMGGIVGMVCSILITLFLSAKIIDFPRGTHEGGLMAAAGVAIILAFMVVVIFVVARLTKQSNQA
jgi:hypothetical protein